MKCTKPLTTNQEDVCSYKTMNGDCKKSGYYVHKKTIGRNDYLVRK